MSVLQYAKKFPILLKLSSPKGQVELQETVGKGNYGFVYKGRLLALNQTAAIKVVFLKEDEIKETLLEMEMLQACKHPNITRYLGAFIKGLDLWICMEFCGGGALDTIKKPFTEDLISAILFDFLSGLEYLHTQAFLIHRDIKAGNVFFTEAGELKIGDFGVSAQLTSASGRARTFIGTPYWMAPEVIMTDPESPSSANYTYDTKADIWSVGITAIEIAEKNPPLSDIHPMRALYLIPKSELNFAKPKNFSKPFQEFVLQCLTKNPNQRPSATQLLQHPFISRAKSLPRTKLMAETIQKVKRLREKRRAGYDDEEDEDEEEKREEVPIKVVSETIRLAKEAQVVSSGLAKETITEEPSEAPSVQVHTTQPSKAPPAGASVNSLHVSEREDFKGITEQLGATRRVLRSISISGVLKIEVLTADVLDETYALLGTSHGLYFIDITKTQPNPTPIPLIRNTRFRQLEIVHEYNSMIALSGKHDHVRQYKLNSIRKLIKLLTGTPSSELVKMNRSGHDVAQSTSDAPKEEDYYKNLHPDVVEDDATLVARWTSDYIKIVGTKDARQCVIERTEGSIFMGVLFKQDVTLFQWAKDPYLKFMKLKAFWLPEPPKSMYLLHDGLNITDICLIYASEANIVSVEDSKVKEVFVHQEFMQAAKGAKGARWQTFSQIPFSDSKRAAMRAACTNATNTVNRKLTAVAGKSATGGQDRFFLSTFHQHTRVVDIAAQPVTGSDVGGWKNGVTWPDTPCDLVLRSMDYVVAICKNCIVVTDWITAHIVQEFKLEETASMKIVGAKSGSIIVCVERKKKGTVVYYLKEPVVVKVLADDVAESPQSTQTFTTPSPGLAPPANRLNPGSTDDLNTQLSQMMSTTDSFEDVSAKKSANRQFVPK